MPNTKPSRTPAREDRHLRTGIHGGGSSRAAGLPDDPHRPFPELGRELSTYLWHSPSYRPCLHDLGGTSVRRRTICGCGSIAAASWAELGEELLFRCQVGCPVEAARAGEAEVGAERVRASRPRTLWRAAARSRRPTRRRAPPPGRGRGRFAARSGRRSDRGTGSAARTSPSGVSPAAGTAPTRSRTRTGCPAAGGPRPTGRTAEGTRPTAAAPAARAAVRRPRV